MIWLNKKKYPYMEEVNDGILRQFRYLTPPPALSTEAGEGARRGDVLDVGCGRGQLGEAIRALGWNVWGVENSPEACETARTRLDGLIERDLHDFDGVAADLQGGQFDALIFSDVLEHVYDPLGVLERYLEHVKPGGKVLISVPNMVVWTNRLRLLFGRVTYSDTGIMDRTHIRFFTFKTAKALVRASGCMLDYTTSTPYLIRAFLPLLKGLLSRGSDDIPHNPRALIESRSYRWYMRWIYPLEHWFSCLWRTLFAFRIIVVATKPVVHPRAPLPAQSPSRQLQEAGGVGA
jgi:2-polyprenyl-3-methyl-5-hydroxy-6-metoxy-1,4-benzoquinol methylase